MSRIYQQKEVSLFILADVEKCAHVRQQLSYNAGERWSNIYFGFPRPALYLTNRWLASWLDYIFHGRRMLYALRHALKSEDFDFLSNLIIRLQKKSVWKHGGGAESQSSTLFGPSSILDHLCCLDPDHNLGGWCYRKLGTPREIVLLHGDSPLFTSSLTGCLKEDREGWKEQERWGGGSWQKEAEAVRF